MGQWDRELIPLLPSSMKVFASAGAGFNWADVDVLAEYGILYCNGAQASSEVRWGLVPRHDHAHRRLQALTGCGRYGNIPHHLGIQKPCLVSTGCSIM